MNWLCRFAPSAVVALAFASLALPDAHAVTIDWVTVGDPGNAADTGGNPNPAGAVAETFRIMKFEWTNSQYVDFLNAVDPSGANPNAIYNTNMGSDARGGISFNTNASAGSKYAARANMGNKPVNFVSWFDAARVSNWLHNGQGSGSTETGAYMLNNATTGNAPAVNPGAQYYLPTENQWYKAAYYKAGGTNAGYWVWPTQVSAAGPSPTSVTADSIGNGSAGSTGNFLNYASGADWNGLDGNVTTVGTNGGPSAYGVFDMGGSLSEMNDLTGAGGSLVGRRGGNFAGGGIDPTSLVRDTLNPSSETFFNGFRLAAVPEPSTYIMALAGLACGGYSMWRRRKHTSREKKNSWLNDL